MDSMKRWSRLTLLSVALGLAACSDNGGPSGGGGGGPTASCQTRFSVEAAAAGDNCAPAADTFCAVPNSQVLSADPLPCDGVTVSEHEITVGDVTTQYLAIRPSSGGTDSMVLALHYLGANTGRFSNVVRLSELAKARKVLVIAPQAPGLAQRWPSNPTIGEDVDSAVALLHGVLSDAKSRFSTGSDPVYALGLSNGAVMAYLFACRAADQIKSVLAVAGELGIAALEGCAPSRAVGTVIVHGNADIVTPYGGIILLYPPVTTIHTTFKQFNGCTGTDSQLTLPSSADPLTVTIDSAGGCASGRRDFLVTIDGGGHNWPGGSADDSTLSTIGLLGAHTRNFDATLQGFDLLRAAGGD